MDVKEAPKVATREFTAHDRCDKCGAQAKTEYVVKSGGLMFCGHHSRENHVLLLAQGFTPITERVVPEVVDLGDDY